MVKLLQLKFDTTKISEIEAGWEGMTFSSFFSLIASYFPYVMLYLNDGDKESARGLAMRVLGTTEVKECADGKRPDIFSRNRWQETRFDLMYYYLLKVCGEREQALKYDNLHLRGDPLWSVWISRQWGAIVQRISAETEKNINKKYLDMPYRPYDVDFFLNQFYRDEFSKMMIKKDYKRAGKMLEAFKTFLEKCDKIKYIFGCDEWMFFGYVDILDALGDVEPGATKLIKEYQIWKESVGW